MGRDNAENSRAKQSKAYKKAECEWMKKAYICTYETEVSKRRRKNQRTRPSFYGKTRAKRKAAESKQDDNNNIAEHPNVDHTRPPVPGPSYPVVKQGHRSRKGNASDDAVESRPREDLIMDSDDNDSDDDSDNSSNESDVATPMIVKLQYKKKDNSLVRINRQVGYGN